MMATDVCSPHRDWLFVGRMPIRTIIRAVARHYGISEQFMRSIKRSRQYSVPRHVAIWLTCHLRPDLSLPQIAHAFDRDHTLVLYAQRKLDAQMEAGLRQSPQAVWAEIQGKQSNHGERA